MRVHDHLGIRGLLIRIGDAGEVGDLPAQGFLVEPLDVAPSQLLDGAAHVDFHEVADLRAGLAPRLLVRRDGRADHRHAVARQQRAHESDAQDVGITVFPGEAQAPGEMGAHDIAVKDLDPAAPCL